MVLYLIELRKYINYFVEQSLINGLWGQFHHEAIAVASILIARFEMKSVHEVRWKRKKTSDEALKLLHTYNPLLNQYKNLSSETLGICIHKIYEMVFDGANFPYKTEI